MLTTCFPWECGYYGDVSGGNEVVKQGQEDGGETVFPEER